jgi:DNA-binding XRE family transcriptional regulator
MRRPQKQERWFPVLENKKQTRSTMKKGPQNSLKQIREKMMMSKAELARKAGVSPLTIDRIESGKNCRMETKRKIILALGYSLEEKDKIFNN